MAQATSEPYILAQTNFGFVIKAYQHDRCSQIIAQCGEFEGAVSRLITNLLKPGNHFVDAGANIGYFTLLAAECVGPSGTVTAFEPARSVRKLLQENVQLLPHRQCVNVLPYALSDGHGTARFYEGPQNHTGISSLRPISQSATNYPVELRQWDEIPSDRPVHVIKLDIEGAEVQALHGMRRTLRRWRPTIVLEVTDRFLREMGSNTQELFALMDELGYQGWTLNGQALEPIRNPDDGHKEQYNAIFTHEDRVALHRLLNRGYHIKKRAFATTVDSRPTPSVLFFSMHGDSSVEIAELCRASGVPLDIGPPKSRLVRTTMSDSERNRLGKLGVGSPDDEAIIQRLRQSVYGAVIVTTDAQVQQFERHLRGYNPHVPLIVRHGNNIFEALKKLNIKHFMGPSRRALEIMSSCNTFHTRKLLDWENLPPVSLDPNKRSGLASYIHKYRQSWPDSWARLERVNKGLANQRVKVFGNGNPDGLVHDLPTMAKSRATVHIKDNGIRCFCVLRSMAMGTPVVVDRLTCERTFLDDVSGIIVCDDTDELVHELNRLATDNAYWLERSVESLSAARRQFTADRHLAKGFLRFIHEAIARN
ncbi:FkbM family methyltransferase [Thalassoroseus pseudoceratinae]|uniref:FkbM family methyltransferase n=1 Tax=Thalassoroseus pseudoceratinae TaxID=2713176 RepID=UPI001421D28B|nr:FkbM family methyltransferase [Thalassoroseus pseudoceratinae]